MTVKKHGVHWDITATDSTASAWSSAERSITRVNKATMSVVDAFRAVLAATVGAELTRELVRAAQSGEQAANRLTASLRAAGNQVGLTRRELDEMADSMAESTQFDDGGLRNAQSQLVKFGNIQGQVFRDAMKVSADLAAFMGTDVADAAQQVGRALQSPTEGITLIERSLGKLTEAQEKNIKSLAAQGKAAEAQNAVLKILQDRLGGTAELMNTGLTKATSDVAKAWNSMLEEWGRSETVGGRVRGMLGGLRDILRDLQGLAKKTTLADVYEGQVRDLDEQLSRVDDMKRMALRRGGPGAVAISGRADARIAELRAERARVLADMQGLRDATTFEDSMNPKPKQGPLGGKVTPEAKKDKLTAAQIAKMQAESWEHFDEEVRKGNALLNEFLDKPRIEGFNRALATQAQAWESVSAGLAKLVVEGNAWEAENVDLAVRLEEMKGKTKETSDFAREMGLSFSSAFEDAIVGGKKFSDVLKGLSQDIARIITRKTITEPLGNAFTKAMGDSSGSFLSGIGDWISGLFGGGRASGGPVEAGRMYEVAEDGPEMLRSGGRDYLLMGSKGGRVSPAGGGGFGSLRSGKQAGGGGTRTTINVYPDLRGASVEAVQALHHMVRSLRANVPSIAVAAVANNNRRGRRS